MDGIGNERQHATRLKTDDNRADGSRANIFPERRLHAGDAACTELLGCTGFQDGHRFTVLNTDYRHRSR
ncbi:hypothetical protein D3C87_2110100 [compost metagenome]